MYIDVYLALPLPQVFTYRVPDFLEEEISFGKRVVVPFGRNKASAYIKKIKDSSPRSDFEIKDIISVEDKIPIFNEIVFELCIWIADYYIYPPGLSIKSVLPSGINPTISKYMEITEHGEAYLKGKEPQLYDLLQDGPVREKDVFDLGYIEKDIIFFKQKNFISVYYFHEKAEVKEKFEKFIYRLNLESNNVLTEKQSRILSLVPYNKAIALKDLSSIEKGVSQVIKSLLKKGLVEEIEKRVFRTPLGEYVSKDTPPKLNEEQERAVKTISPYIGKEFRRYLLFGVTGSGKTEVYLRLVEKAISEGKSAIVLVPEIALVSQTEKRFRARFGENIAVLHSHLSAGEKLDQWHQIILGDKKIIIGARSAIFAPVENTGIIIVDEEHDTSYKQDTAPRYNARDMAIVRASMEKCPVILGSATPSMESWHNVETGKFEILKLMNRVNKSSLPEVTIVDLKEKDSSRNIYKYISYYMSLEIGKRLKKNEQVLLFLNRRGYSNFVLCNTCGEAVKCQYCSVSMTLHMNENILVCHMCGFTISKPDICPSCQSPELAWLGAGTEKIEKACGFLFPQARVIRIDQDTTSRKGELIKKLKSIQTGEAEIIIGTQMIAKGHDFPNITLVGIINADIGFNFPDFRAGERSFQLLSQVAGRAGRGEKEGKVILQTFNPDHFTIQTAKNQDYERFYKKEASFRKALFYPPFSKAALIKISGEDEDKTKKFAEKFLNCIRQNREIVKNLQILGPAKAPLFKVALRFRFQILMKGKSQNDLNKVIKKVRSEESPPKGIRVSIDMDPYSMM